MASKQEGKMAFSKFVGQKVATRVEEVAEGC
jgi:hypothetical protein